MDGSAGYVQEGATNADAAHRSGGRGETAPVRVDRGWLSRRVALLAALLAFTLAAVPALAGPGSFDRFEYVGRDARLALTWTVEQLPAVDTPVVMEEAVELAETAEPVATGEATVELTVTQEATVTASPTETAEPSATVEPPPTQEPTETVEPTETAEPTEVVEPTETAEPSPTAEPTESPVRVVARENHGAAVSEVAKSHDGEGNHGEQVRAVARDNHGRVVSEAAKAKQAGDEDASSVSETARNNHGAAVREAAQQHGKGTGGKPANGLDD